MTGHDQTPLGGYALGAESPAAARDIEEHLLTCSGCRECLGELADTRAMLDAVPPEALLDGAIEDNDLLLGRILHQAAGADPAPVRPARHTRSPWLRPGRLLVAAAAVAVLAGVFGGGVVTGRQSATPTVAAAETHTAHDPTTGVGMTISLTRQVGWVALTGRFTGVKPGSPCLIVVVTHNGQRITAGAWVAPADANTATVEVNGSAIVPPSDLASIEVDTTSGQKLVATNV